MQISRSPLFKFDRQVPIYNWYYPLHTTQIPALTFARAIALLSSLDPARIRRRALYFHIPFYETICSFCPFVRGRFETDNVIEHYAQALIQEIRIKAELPFFRDVPVRAIFFGGGTPSLLSPKQIIQIGRTIQDHFDLADLSKFSFEMEVKSVDEERLLALQSIGVTHLRFGLQTFNPLYRHLFNLTATVDQIYHAALLMKSVSDYVSFDMLYGMNGQTIDDLLEDVRNAILLDAPLVDFYPINNVATQPKLHRAFASRGLPPTSARTKLAMSVVVNEFMRSAGYLPHNGHGYVKVPPSEMLRNPVVTDLYSFRYHDHVYGYEDVDLIGFGVNAISSTSRWRIQNAANRGQYIKSLRADGQWNMQIGMTDPRANASRPVILALPYHGEIDADRIGWEHVYPETLERLYYVMEAGLVEAEGGKLRLTHEGWRWYSDIMYYLLPRHERDAVDELIREAARDRDRKIS